MNEVGSASKAPAAKLLRTLTLWDLILYGVVIIQPTAPMSVFGVVSDRAHGHVVTSILIAMVAMLFTAISYGRMARAYPSAGSAFTYVGKEINPALGYITGWSMVMDYMLNPIICIVWISNQAHAFAHVLPYWGWVLFFSLLLVYLNILGIRLSAKINAGLAAGMGIVIALFFIAAAHYIFGHPHNGTGFFTRPFFDPATFSTRAVLGGTSVAVLTYIGFDGISTLSEEATNPRRNILLATVLTCIDFGILKWPSSAFCFGPPQGTDGYSKAGKARSGGTRWTGEPRWSYSKRSVESMSSAWERLPEWQRSWEYTGGWFVRPWAALCLSHARRPSGRGGS